MTELSSAHGIAETIAAAMASVGLEPISATIYGSVALGEYDEHSDVDVLAVGKDGPPDTETAHNLEDLLDHVVDLPVHITWYTPEAVRRHAEDAADIVTSVIEQGVHIKGLPIRDIAPHAVQHNPVAAARRARDAALERVVELRDKDLSDAPADDLASILVQAANAALLAHGKGRFKPQRPAASKQRLTSVVGDALADTVQSLHDTLSGQITRPPAEVRSEVEDVVNTLLRSAANPDAPGPRSI